MIKDKLQHARGEVIRLKARLISAERVLKLNRTFMRDLHKMLATRKVTFDKATHTISMKLEGNLKAVDALLLEPEFAARGLAMKRSKNNE